MSNADRIAVLDNEPLVADQDGAREALAEAVGRSCEDTGFLVIANHGIDPALIDGSFAAALDFFNLDEPSRRALKVGDLNIGYLPYGAQIVRTSKVDTNTKPNPSKSFYIVTDRSVNDPEIVAGNPLYGLNRWPQGMPSFKKRTLVCFQQMRPLAHRIVSVIAASLGLPADYFDPDFHEPTFTLRVIRYPSHDGVEDNQFGFAPHVDTSFLTLHAQPA